MHAVSPQDKTKSNSSYGKRLCLPLLFSLLFLCLLTWVGYVYTRSENKLKESLQKINAEKDRRQSLIQQTSSYMTLVNKAKNNVLLYSKLLENFSQKLKTLEQRRIHSINKKGFTALSLCGKTGQTVKSNGGRLFPDWKITLNVGNINYTNNFIVINTPGVYFVYAQMFFFQNKDSFRRKIMDFHISKNRQETLVLASVPVTTCPEACTRYISSVVKLQKNDRLAVSSYGNNIQFKISQEKCQFGVVLLEGSTQ
ncbi:uncharacterized protein LOC130635925 [Hydractinia symbiolongicarpus]|uniref:uncharacterized protein LOC130635925 n=1 Tax=Hydractinia symbiolongicarpus TaxID=13093 RepID=UPI00254D0617|nr:uncharacterized protein LOC130635925 [Hydractinia symbiolongicarpus]XP_057301434.1 uncharacterized protein LOC130635925 [Hydractinia symbiolongicarpus]XP_057301435.1 uncharacterized protein LOC130635925 [Hydractinia symbiolongicarpus]